MLLSMFLIIYILFFGLTGFYGRRFLLPVYPVLAILIAKTLFVDFFDLLMNMEEWDTESQKRFDKYGINRSNKKFWEYYDWFQNRFNREQPVHSGLFDLNRYFHVAL